MWAFQPIPAAQPTASGGGGGGSSTPATWPNSGFAVWRYGLTALLALGLAAALAGDAAAQPRSAPSKPRQVPTTGYIDPTVPTSNSGQPLVACAASCSDALATQNTAALQWALNLAGANPHPWIYLPPGEYPIKRNGLHTYALIASGSDLTISGYGATLRAQGNMTLGTFYALQLANISHVRLLGLTWSQRDATNIDTDQTHVIEVGDGLAADGADNIEIIDNVFHESLGGDCIRLVGPAVPTVPSYPNVTRILIKHNYFFECHRSGVAFQHGVRGVNVIENSFIATGNSSIDFESTNEGEISNISIDRNTMIRNDDNLNCGIEWSLGGYKISPSFSISFTYNTLSQAGSLGGNADTTWVVGNTSFSDSCVAADGNFAFVSVCHDLWILDNWAHYDGAGATAMISATPFNSRSPDGVWVEGNRLEQYSSSDGTIDVSGSTHVWVNDNRVSYHGSRTQAGANGLLHIRARSLTPGQMDGWITRNTMTRELQLDGVTQAGRPLAGIQFDPETTPSVGHMTIRDNFVDDALDVLFMTQSSANSPQGPATVSGNTSNTFTNEFSQTGVYYRSETTGDRETLTGAGALSPSRRATLITGDCGNDLDTLAAGTSDGLIKHIKVTAGCASTGTLTPAAFGDGTSVSWSTSSTAYFALAWDEGTGKWWLIDKSAGVSINP